MDIREGGASVACLRGPGGRDAAGDALDPASLGLPPDFPVGQRHLMAGRR